MARVVIATSMLVGCLVAEAPAAGAAEPVSVSALPSAEVEKLLSEVPLADLSAPQLSEVLAQRLSGSPSSELKKSLTETIEHLASKEDTLGQLVGQSAVLSELETTLKGLLPEGLLGGLLKGGSLSQLLTEALGSANGREVIGELLKLSGESGQPLAPEELLEQILGATSSEQLEGLLGGKLTGAPISTGTVEELAGQVGTTPGQLASDFDTTTEQLPATAMAMTAPLTNGKLLGVLDSLEGIDVGTLSHELTGGGGAGTGGSGAGGGSGGGGAGGGGAGGGLGGLGGVGGSGGSAGSSTPAGTVVIYQTPAAATGTAPSGSGAKAAGKVRILSGKVKGDVATLLVQVPAAGSARIAGRRIRFASKQAERAERLTLRAVLTKAAATSVRRHRRLTIKVEVTFKPVSGAGSTATATVSFR